MRQTARDSVPTGPVASCPSMADNGRMNRAARIDTGRNGAGCHVARVNDASMSSIRQTGQDVMTRNRQAGSTTGQDSAPFECARMEDRMDMNTAACGKTFGTGWDMYRHETGCKTCNPDTVHPVACRVSSRCKMTFATVKDAVRHSTSCKYNGDSDDSIREDMDNA